MVNDFPELRAIQRIRVKCPASHEPDVADDGDGLKFTTFNQLVGGAQLRSRSQSVMLVVSSA